MSFERKCNLCGDTFIGDHECDYIKLQKDVKRYREDLSVIRGLASLVRGDQASETLKIIEQYVTKALAEKE